MFHGVDFQHLEELVNNKTKRFFATTHAQQALGKCESTDDFLLIQYDLG